MKIQDVIQEIRKYNIEFDTNIISIKKVDNQIIFEINVSDLEINKKKIKGDK